MNLDYSENQLLIIFGIIPFIALTNSALNGLCIGILILLTLFFSNLIFGFFSDYVKEPERTMILIILTATIVSILGSILLRNAPALYNNLGVFIPLIAVNSFVVRSLKKMDSKYPKIKYGFKTVKDFLPAIVILFVIGVLREITSKGMVLNKPLLNSDPEATLILFSISPAGGLIITGIVIAFYGLLKSKKKNG